MDEGNILCPYCMAELPAGASGCSHCGRAFAGRSAVLFLFRRR